MARLRDLGLTTGSLPPGEHNAVTDVAGVRVGHTTIVRGDDVRTGVTVILPHEAAPWDEPVFAGAHRLNGNGELTGLEWIRESGMLGTPVGLTNTHSVGVVRDALVAAEAEARDGTTDFWSLPVVGETWDGVLNDVNGMHVTAADVRAALDSAASGQVAEGSVGGGTGMICHGFKGGFGTASRVVPQGWTVGVLVQANHGRRERFSVLGRAVGEAIPASEVPTPAPSTVRPQARSSSSSRPMRRCCRSSVRGSRSAPGWASPASAASARTSAATSSSASRPATGDCRRISPAPVAASPSTCAWSRTSGSRRSSTPWWRRRRRRSSTRCSARRP
jgi:D-aminopeptidase